MNSTLTRTCRVLTFRRPKHIYPGHLKLCHQDAAEEEEAADEADEEATLTRLSSLSFLCPATGTKRLFFYPPGWPPPLQLRKPVSTLSIPGSMKTPCAGGNRDSGAVAGNEEAGIALVGVHSEYPR